MVTRSYQVTQQQGNPKVENLMQLKSYLNTGEMQRRFREILGERAPQFMASIINAVNANQYLAQCEPQSVIQAALIAATYNLPIDGNLGFAAIVPYKDGKSGTYKGQFQIMYRGLIQLAIRSGEYSDINCEVVYEDELKGYNPITGEVSFTDDFGTTTQRSEGDPSKVVGYYAWFRLARGFTHGIYLTKKQVDNHARKYSQSYQQDIRKGWTSSRWTQDFDAMAKKTVLKQLLSKWGILSIDTQMQRAIEDDQKVYDANGNGEYLDNPTNIEQLPEVREEAPNIVGPIASQEEPNAETPREPQIVTNGRQPGSNSTGWQNTPQPQTAPAGYPMGYDDIDELPFK